MLVNISVRKTITTTHQFEADDQEALDKAVKAHAIMEPNNWAYEETTKINIGSPFTTEDW